MPREEAVTISFDLGIAALVGENLYNFGELLEHPVISVLQETEFAWLAHLLRAFNAGDIAQYEVLVAAHHTQLEAQPALLQVCSLGSPRCASAAAPSARPAPSCALRTVGAFCTLCGPRLTVCRALPTRTRPAAPEHQLSQGEDHADVPH